MTAVVPLAVTMSRGIRPTLLQFCSECLAASSADGYTFSENEIMELSHIVYAIKARYVTYAPDLVGGWPAASEGSDGFVAPDPRLFL